MKRVGLAERTLRRLRERRVEVEREFTLEAVTLLHRMFCVPDSEWNRDDQYRGDTKGDRECAAIARWIDKYLMSAEGVTDGDQAKQVLALLNAAYGEGQTEQAKIQAWNMARRVIGRQYQPGKYKIKDGMLDRMKIVLEHYAKKKSRTYLVTHFADLECGLKGEPLPSFDQVAD